MKVKLLSRVRLLATPWTEAYQAPPSMGFSRQQYWSGVPLPSPIDTYLSPNASEYTFSLKYNQMLILFSPILKAVFSQIFPIFVLFTGDFVIENVPQASA